MSPGNASVSSSAITWTNYEPAHWAGSSLVQVMAYGLSSIKSLPEPMLTYCQFDP